MGVSTGICSRRSAFLNLCSCATACLFKQPQLPPEDAATSRQVLGFTAPCWWRPLGRACFQAMLAGPPNELHRDDHGCCRARRGVDRPLPLPAAAAAAAAAVAAVAAAVAAAGATGGAAGACASAGAAMAGCIGVDMGTTTGASLVPRAAAAQQGDDAAGNAGNRRWARHRCRAGGLPPAPRAAASAAASIAAVSQTPCSQRRTHPLGQLVFAPAPLHRINYAKKLRAG
eukprot:364453-Chlamydomonas_euryale.AAC.3